MSLLLLDILKGESGDGGLVELLSFREESGRMRIFACYRQGELEHMAEWILVSNFKLGI